MKGAPNRYATRCGACRDLVAAGDGVLTGPPWRVECHRCRVARLRELLEHAEAETALAPPAGIELVNAALGERGHALRPYQLEGARWLASRRRALLADDQGLGKTVQVLAALPRDARVVVVAPAVARGVWYEHAERLRPDLCTISLEGRDDWHHWRPGDFACVSWACLPKRFGVFHNTMARIRGRGTSAADARQAARDKLEAEVGALPEFVIYDEAHYAKNAKSLRTRRARGLTSAVRVAWGLTGTPLKNLPPDLHSVLQALELDRDTWPSFAGFARAFGARKAPFGTVWTGPRSPKIPGILRRVMLRRLKSDVLAELPAKSYETIPVELDAATAKACDEAAAALRAEGVELADMTEEALRAASGAGFEQLATAAKALAIAKVPAVLDLLDMWELDTREPRIVWSRHVAPLRAIGEREGWQVITGATNDKRRREYVEAFQAGELRGLALSIGAAATAITLTAGSHAIYLDRAWSPSDNAQSEDRIHRIGQRRACRYTLLVADHEIDRALERLLFSKAQTITETVDAASVD